MAYEKEKVAHNIREAMKSRGINTAQISQTAGVGYSNLSDFLRQPSEKPDSIKLSTAIQVADALGMTVSTLIGESKAPDVEDLVKVLLGQLQRDRLLKVSEDEINVIATKSAEVFEKIQRENYSTDLERRAALRALLSN